MNNSDLILGNQTQPKGQIGAMVTLAYIVADIQNEMDNYSPQLYKRAMQILIGGLREIRLYHQSSIQVGYFELSDSGVLPYPSDYLNYTKIGIPIQGQLVTLSVNEKMLLNRAQKCGEDIRRMREYSAIGSYPFTDGYAFAPHYYAGRYIGALYGAGGGFNTAYFRDDPAAQQIQFDGIIPATADKKMVVMEYESTGISEGTLLSAELIEPLKNWYFWKTARHDKSTSNNKVMMFNDDYQKSLRKLRAYTQQFTREEFMDSMYRNYKQTPKI